MYVGKTETTLSRRLIEHISTSKRKIDNNKKRQWIRGLIEKGLRPEIKELELCQKENWREREKYWLSITKADKNTYSAGGGGDGQRTLNGQIDSVKHLMGQISDSRVAEIISVSRKTITYYREKLGIPAAKDRTRNVKPPCNIEKQTIVLPDNIIKLLGTMPDYKLGEIAGVSKKKIMKSRHIRNIKPYSETTENTGKYFKGMPHPRWSKIGRSQNQITS